MNAKALIFIFIYLMGTFFSVQVSLAEMRERQYLHILKESGQYKEAYEEYEAAIAKDPESVPLVLDFVELLIDMERFDEAWNQLEKIGREDINAVNGDDKRRIALNKTGIFMKREEFDKALSEIEPFADSRDDRLFIADVYLMGGEWKESLKVLGEVGGLPYYTPYERDLARKKMVYVRKHYNPRINADGGIVDSSAHGTIPWGAVSGLVPIGQNNRIATSYLWLDDGGFFSVALNGSHSRCPPVDSYELLLSITDDGDGGGSVKKTFCPTRRSRAELKGYYNEVEREVTPLMAVFALKKGASLGLYHRFSDTLTGSCKYEYSDYTQDRGCMNILNIGGVRTQHLSVERPTLNHIVAMLVIEGSGDENYVAHHVYMPSYTFRLSYPVSDEYYSDHVAFKIGLGYLFGIDNEGFSFSPGCSFDLHVHGDVSLTGGAEYRLDEISGEGEWRINGGVEMIF